MAQEASRRASKANINDPFQILKDVGALAIPASERPRRPKRPPRFPPDRQQAPQGPQDGSEGSKERPGGSQDGQRGP